MPPEPSSRAAVLVPLYKTSMTAAEAFSFRRTLAVLAAHDIYVIGPRSLSAYFTGLRSESGSRFGVMLFDDGFFSGVPGYNRLLKSKAFYRTFEGYEYVLIAQTDALIIADGLEDWCARGFSYVGAPWFRGFDIPRRPLSFFGVGNGGLSLRKVEDCIKALSRPRYIPNFLDKELAPAGTTWLRIARTIKHRLVRAYNFDPLKADVNEDLFWGKLVAESCDFFRVPALDEAARFAFEAEPEFLYELTKGVLPFGCHAWERYSLAFWQKNLGEIGIDLPWSNSDPSSLK